MKYIRSIITQGLIAGCVAPAVFAGRPLTVDDADPVPPRMFEFEAGGLYSRDTEVHHFDRAFNLAYGVLRRLELGIGAGGQFEEREDILGRKDRVSGIGDLTLGAKGKVLNADQAWADHALAFSVKVPTADRDRELGTGEYDYDLLWIASKPLGERWNVHANFSYTWLGGSSEEGLDDILHYGLAADYQISEAVQLVAEVFAGSPVSTVDDTSVFLNGGLRWAVLESLVFDAAVGTGIYGPAPEILTTVGLTWIFGTSPSSR